MKSLGVSGSCTAEVFVVTDSQNDLIENIPPSAFSVDLFDPAGTECSNTITITISELLNGHYRSCFTPNKIGIWNITVYHPQYFPWGKSGSFQIYGSDFDTISDDLAEVLGLVHSNMFIDNPIYDGDGNLTAARIRIYSNSDSVGTENNIIGTYQISAPGGGAGKFTYWKQIKT